MPAKPFNFEKAIVDLEEIVERMEDENLSLEQSLKNFEKGIQLTQQCQKALQEAEQKVRILLEKNGTSELVDFNEEEDTE